MSGIWIGTGSILDLKEHGSLAKNDCAALNYSTVTIAAK